MALAAGSAPARAAALGVSMTLLQLGIGTVNDIVDAPADAGRKPGKPIPAGLVPPNAARGLAAAWIASGIALAWSISPVVGVLAVVVAAIGLAYDLALKGTAWSWLPFAVGIPILPVYGWIGVGALPWWFLVLVPVAVVAGTALAIGNSLVDVERDRAAGRTSVASALGRRRAGWVAIALLATVGVVAGATLVAREAPLAPALTSVAACGVAVAAAWIASRRPERAERAWQLEAISLAIAAVAWIVAILG